MGELENEYAGRVNFEVIPAEETAKRSAEIDQFGFTEMMHGLVVFGPDGEAAVKMPGHQFGREEIIVSIETVLPAD